MKQHPHIGNAGASQKTKQVLAFALKTMIEKKTCTIESSTSLLEMPDLVLISNPRQIKSRSSGEKRL